MIDKYPPVVLGETGILLHGHARMVTARSGQGDWPSLEEEQID
jgi:hypothetical protein